LNFAARHACYEKMRCEGVDTQSTPPCRAYEYSWGKHLRLCIFTKSILILQVSRLLSHSLGQLYTLSYRQTFTTPKLIVHVKFEIDVDRRLYKVCNMSYIPTNTLSHPQCYNPYVSRLLSACPVDQISSPRFPSECTSNVIARNYNDTSAILNSHFSSLIRSCRCLSGCRFHTGFGCSLRLVCLSVDLDILTDERCCSVSRYTTFLRRPASREPSTCQI
jgi:hypothetical protein